MEKFNFNGDITGNNHVIGDNNHIVNNIVQDSSDLSLDIRILELLSQHTQELFTSERVSQLTGINPGQTELILKGLAKESYLDKYASAGMDPSYSINGTGHLYFIRESQAKKTPPSSFDKIRKLISQNKLQDALESLENIRLNESERNLLIHLKRAFFDNKEQRIRGVLEESQLSINDQKVVAGLLSLIDLLETPE